MRSMPARTCLVATLLALAVTAGGQWVEDSALSGPNVSNLVYDRNAGYVVGTSWDEGIFGIKCATSRRDGGRSVHWPLGLALSTLSNRFYVAHGNWHDDTIVVMGSGPHFDVYRRIPQAGASKPLWDSVSNRVYVSCASENEVAVIDCETDSVVDHIRVGREPERPELNTRHRRLYVRNWDSETVSIIDLETNEVVETIRLSGVPKVGCYHAGADKYYVGISGGVVVAVSGNGDTVCAEVELPPGVSVEALVVPGSELLLVGANAVSTDTVYAIDTRTDSVVDVCHLPAGRPTSMVWSPATNLVYCATSRDSVAVLPADGSSVLRTLAVGDFPQVLAVAPEYGRVYVGHAGSEYVYAIRDTVSGIAEPGGSVARSPAMRAWPSPFRTRLTIELPDGVAAGTVQVHSSDGRLVSELACRPWREGLVAEWDGRYQNGRDAPEGVYIVTARSAGFRAVSAMKVR